MNNFTFFTRSGDLSKSRMFFETAERFGIPIGIDTGNESFVDLEYSYPRLINNLENCNTPYVLLTDSFDVLMTRWDEKEVIHRVGGARGHVIISGEPECWPKGPWSKNYKNLPSLWSYACGGQLVGTREAILDLTKVIYSRRQEVSAGGGNQELLHILVGENYPMEIDTECRIFQCMRTEAAKHVKAGLLGLPHNILTDSWPMFLHFNDLKNTPGMPEWFDILMHS